jgi:ubiquinone/menaquinone biosynthesis C-methylase UbiE
MGRAASSYANSFAHATALAPLLKAAGISPGEHVLDVACGPGHLAAAASARGATAHGLDFSAEMVGIACNAHPDVVVTEGDAEDLPYPDRAFLAVVSGFGIHHVPRPELALARCRRVLKPGGRMAFTVWAARALLAALSASTARMAALASQEPSLAAIADDIDRQAERFRRDGNLALPLQRCRRGAGRPQTDEKAL